MVTQVLRAFSTTTCGLPASERARVWLPSSSLSFLATARTSLHALLTQHPIPFPWGIQASTKSTLKLSASAETAILFTDLGTKVVCNGTATSMTFAMEPSLQMVATAIPAPRHSHTLLAAMVPELVKTTRPHARRLNVLHQLMLPHFEYNVSTQTLDTLQVMKA